MKLAKALAIGIALTSTAAFAQTTAPKAPAPSTPSATVPGSPTGGATAMDPAAETKFKANDKDNNGMLSGAELSSMKADLTKIDTNKDGNVSREEFAAAMKSGVIK